MISEYMTEDHRRCDVSFANAEEAVSKEDFGAAQSSFGNFKQTMEAHFSMEENVLFPEFESQTGNSAGPTQVMRVEHRQIRALLEEMASTLAGQDVEGYLGHSETLLVMMQQHNMKEEHILYPMTDQALIGP